MNKNRKRLQAGFGGFLVGILIAMFSFGLGLFTQEMRQKLGLEEERLPRFVGQVEHGEIADRFLSFLGDNQYKTVFLDVQMDEYEVIGTYQDDGWLEAMTLWSDCRDLASGEQPSIPKCLGNNIQLVDVQESSDYDFFCQRGACTLSGHFAVRRISGPYTNYMSYQLKPVNIEEIH